MKNLIRKRPVVLYDVAVGPMILVLVGIPILMIAVVVGLVILSISMIRKARRKQEQEILEQTSQENTDDQP